MRVVHHIFSKYLVYKDTVEIKLYYNHNNLLVSPFKWFLKANILFSFSLKVLIIDIQINLQHALLDNLYLV